VSHVPSADVVILLPSDWGSLESMPTRWHHVVKHWREDGRVGRITVVSLPSYRRRYALERRLAWPETSWLPGVSAARVLLAIGRGPSPIDFMGWGRSAHALERILPDSRHRILVATHPLWARFALGVAARRRGFDAFDDWQTRPASAALRERLADGYRRLRHFDVVTAHTGAWADRLRMRAGVDVTVVGNGVDLERFEGLTEHHPGLPDKPFAVYVGSIEDRVDLDLLELVASPPYGLPVVVAGPSTGATADRLRAGPLIWLGPLGPEAVPALLRAAAVGLLPHRVNDFTASMDPLKVLEYLAAGIPVVATGVPVSAGAEDHVRIAGSPSEFKQLTVEATESPRPGPPREFLETRSWDQVSKRLLDAYLDV